jgi:hypothetical protein
VAPRAPVRRGRRRRRHALAELDAAALPPVLRDWLAAVLDPARIARSDVPAAPAPRTPGHLALSRLGVTEPIPDLAPGTPLDPVTLAATLEYWLHTLRPDLPAARRPWDRRGRVLLLLEGDDDEPEFARSPATPLVDHHPPAAALAAALGLRAARPIASRSPGCCSPATPASTSTSTT